MKNLVLFIFTAGIFAAVITGFPLPAALSGGLILLCVYAHSCGWPGEKIGRTLLRGLLKARNVLINFLLVGMMTGLWRLSGTIPSIISYTSGFLKPGVFLLLVFLINALVSFITGTALGTGSTIGVICAAAAQSLQVSPVWTGGAILSGCFFGDRCSPVSTGRLLIAELTGTDQYSSIRGLLRTGAVPFAVSCIVYLAAGLTAGESGAAGTVRALMEENFRISPVMLLPAAAILILSFCRVGVKKVLLVSIGISAFLSLFLQGRTLQELFGCMVFGFRAEEEELGTLLNGGGLLSMVQVALIVSISSAYSGIFENTDLLKGLQTGISRLASGTNGYAATLAAAALTSVIACNQTLTIMMTDQLCRNLTKNRQQFALWLSNTAAVVAPLVPWSVAGSVIIILCGLPLSAIAAGCYLYLIPIWNLIDQFSGKKENSSASSCASSGCQH